IMQLFAKALQRAGMLFSSKFPDARSSRDPGQPQEENGTTLASSDRLRTILERRERSSGVEEGFFKYLQGIARYVNYTGNMLKKPVPVTVNQNVPVGRFSLQTLLDKPLIFHRLPSVANNRPLLIIYSK